VISLPRTDRARPWDRLRAIDIRSWRPAAPYGVAGLAAVLAVQTWFKPDRFVAEGDVAPFFRTNL